MQEFKVAAAECVGDDGVGFLGKLRKLSTEVSRHSGFQQVVFVAIQRAATDLTPEEEPIGALVTFALDVM